MRLVLGLDVGWSTRRRSCALAIRGPFSVSRPRKFQGDISVGLFRLDELLDELTRLVRTHAEAFRGALLVIDGPVGPQIDAVPERGVDGSFARAGFYNRAPGYPITQGSGLELSKATAQILRRLDGLVPVRPWFGGPLPTDGIVVAETNPTPAMALLFPQQPVDTLPSRGRPREVDGVTIRAKSDWYWRLGAGQYTARLLGDASIAEERNHERVAGLFALALASALADSENGSSVCALGDRNGIYVVPSDLDETWATDVRRVGVAHGVPAFGARQVAEVLAPKAHDLAVLGPLDEATPADQVTVVLNDNAGLNTAANDWLEGIEVPCRLRGPNEIVFTVVEAFRGREDMYRVTPSTLTLAQRLGFKGDHLSKSVAVAFQADLSVNEDERSAK